MKVAIIGLGLIGGSIARRLRGFHNCTISAYNRTAETVLLAKQDGAIDEGSSDVGEVMDNADLIILCLYPQLNVDMVKNNLSHIKPGAVITDVSGVKGFMIDEMSKILPDNVDFIGAHPMAGREVGGYQSSTDTLFNKASFLITPTKKNKPENIALIRELAEYIGCKHVVTTTPEEHDAVIAYTSQLMHVVAVALCDNPMIERSTFFSAGSLRDCTRVAIINAQMWSELFVENKEQLVNRIHEMQASLGKIAEAVENSDREMLEEIMTHAKITINYIPNVKKKKKKSLKLYLFSFRNQGDFHEDCINIIMKDLVKLMEPKYLEVKGIFTPRGGISIYPFANYGQPGTKYEKIAENRLFDSLK